MARVAQDFLSGGETGALIASMDWSATPLGPRDAWPESLRTVVDLILASSFPMAILWGSDLIFIYNDAYRVIAADRHPRAMGRSNREIWPEVWEFNKPVFERVMTRGETVHFEDQLFPIVRQGCLQDAYFTLSYSPICGEAGAIGGTLVVLVETTQRISAEKDLEAAHKDLEKKVEARTADLRAEIAERKRAEEELRKTERAYQALLDHSMLGIARCKTVFDAHGAPTDYEFVEVNDAYSAITGLTDLIGRRITDVVPGVEREIIDFHNEVALSGVSRQREVYVHNLDRWYWVNVYSPEPGQFVALFGDITESKRMEESLRQQSEEFQQLLDMVPAAVWVARDPECLTITGNRRADQFYEASGGENVSATSLPDVRRFFDRNGRELAASELPMQVSVTTNQEVRDYELHVRLPSGHQMTMLGSAIPLRDAKSDVRGCIGTFIDITERKVAEDELRKSLDTVRQNEERLRVLIQNVRSGVALVDEAGTFSVVNRAFLRMFGLDSESDILNVNSQDWGRWEVCGEDGKLLHVDDHPVRKAAMTGKPVINQLVAVRHPGANEPTWMLINAEPLLREDGTAYTVISTYYDITERKSMEEELRQSRDELELRVQERTESLRHQTEALSASEKEFRLLAEAMPQIVWITRADGWNVYFNQQWVDYTGLTPEESYGYGWNKPFHPDDQQRAWDAWQNAVTNNGTYSLECRLRKADGTYRWWLIRGVPVVNEKGETKKWFGTCTDIEEFKRVEDQLRQAQKMEALGTLTGGVAHDFNNILAAIIGFTELVADHVPKESREAHHLKRVMESSLRGRDLVRQMLTFSRRAEQNKKPLSLSTIVEETVKLIRATTPTTISIKVDMLKESGPILADPTQMQQVVMNLCTNAAHAMREKGGTLDIEVSNHRVSLSDGNPDGMNPGLYTRLTILDTGIGIPPEIMAKIFDPFFTTKKLGEGTGLGLSVVHGIVKQSNGHITVESLPGKGSTFTLYFPQITGELEAETVSDDELPTGSERILFVDDEEALVEMGEDILAELGYEVTSRMSSKNALALLKEDPSRFDLVITDQTMPEMTGIELAKEMLTVRADMPIIMCTGFSHMVNEGSAKAAGIKAFAMKPLTKREIAKTIRKVLDE